MRRYSLPTFGSAKSACYIFQKDELRAGLLFPEEKN
jgi:hypothetical protein